MQVSAYARLCCTGVSILAFTSSAFMKNGTRRHFFLQPMDGPNRAGNAELALRYCLDHPRWRLNWQTHKIRG
jgi:hypothetical protein